MKKAILIEFGSIKEIEIDGEWSRYYHHLDAKFFCCTHLRLDDGRHLTVLVDPAGLYKSKSFVTHIKGRNDFLVGKIILMGGLGENGETLPFPDDIDPNSLILRQQVRNVE